MAKRKIHIPLRAYLLYLLLITFVLTGVTFSKYVTSTYGGDSARVAELGKLSITENGEVPTHDPKFMILPGVDITKNAVVHFSDSEMACYVFVEIDAKGFSVSGKRYSYGESLMIFTVDDMWQKLPDEDSVYYIEVAAGDTLRAPVIANGGRITVSDTMTQSEVIVAASAATVDFRVTAVQLGGFENASAAYKAVK